MKFGGDTGIDADFEPYVEMPKKVNTVFNNWHNRLVDGVNAIDRNELKIPKKVESLMVCDLKDHLKICELMSEGKFNVAKTLAMGLDTASIDEIPCTVWDWLTK